MTGEICYWCHTSCAGTCLNLTESMQMRPEDPCYWMLSDGHTSTSEVFNPDCYICLDPEYAAMGLPLCMKCIACGGHVPADDSVCSDCEADQMDLYQEAQNGTN